MTTPKSKLNYVQETATSSNNVVTFNITASFEGVAGDLPDGVTGVFVKQALIPDDPKSDKFLRVATLADLGRVANTREVAISATLFAPAGGNYIRSRSSDPSLLYLSPYLTLAFDNLQVAMQAKTALEQRVDALIADWRTFNLQYVPATATEFPLADSGLIASLKTAYYNAITNYVATLNVQKNAQAAYVAADASVNRLTVESSFVSVLKPLVCGAKDNLFAYIASYTTYTGPNGSRMALRGVIESAGTYVKNATDFGSLKNTLNSVLADAQNLAGSDDDTVSFKASAATARDALTSYGEATSSASALDNSLTTTLAADVTAFNQLVAANTGLFQPAYDAIVLACSQLDTKSTTVTSTLNTARDALASAIAAQTNATANASAAQTATNLAYTNLRTECPSYDAKNDPDLPEMGEWRSTVLAGVV